MTSKKKKGGRADGWLKGWEQRVGEGGSRGLGKVGAEGWGRWKQRVGEGGSRGLVKMGARGSPTQRCLSEYKGLVRAYLSHKAVVV